MQVFEANVRTIVLRYYLMMAVIIAALFSGVYWLAILGLPIFLSALLGIRARSVAQDRKSDSKVIQLPETRKQPLKTAI